MVGVTLERFCSFSDHVKTVETMCMALSVTEVNKQFSKS